MAEKDLILAIDNGTQSLKALIFSPDGQLSAKAQVPFQPYFSLQPGWAEQDPEVFWRALIEACQTLWQSGQVDKDRLAGLALTTQRGTIIVVDQDGRPLRPAISWLDQRKAYNLGRLGGFWGLIFRLTGLTSTLELLRAEAEVNWIRTNEPDLWAKVYKILLVSGYLTYKLTGGFLDSVGCQVAYLPFNNKKLRWAGGWDWRWTALGLKPEVLPDLVSPGRPLGEVTPAAAAATGLPAGLPVIAAAADKACEVIGSGCLDPSIGCLSYGTTATINVTTDKYYEAIRLLPAYPSAIPDYYSMEVQIFRGYWMVSWFKEEFGLNERRMAELQGVEAEALFDQLVAKIPAGSMGLVLQPYWTPGLKLPGPEAKGAVIGFGDVHTRAHLYKSILEGLAYALREGKERIEKRTRVPITTLMVSGGGSQSRVAMQVTADIFGLPTTRPSLYETSALGAAIDAAVGLGFHNDFFSAIKTMTRAGEVFEPNPETHALYDALYREVYLKLYQTLRPLYEKIRTITGYPSLP
ncbi:MAG: FGGY-family carbohydrate kinase [Thermodesulfobacteriota bacterium]